MTIYIIEREVAYDFTELRGVYEKYEDAVSRAFFLTKNEKIPSKEIFIYIWEVNEDNCLDVHCDEDWKLYKDNNGN